MKKYGRKSNNENKMENSENEVKEINKIISETNTILSKIMPQIITQDKNTAQENNRKSKK